MTFTDLSSISPAAEASGPAWAAPSRTRPQPAGDVGSEAPSPKMADACAEFESMFLYFLLKQMRASIPDQGFWGKNMQTDTMTAMADMQLAHSLSAARGIGLASYLQRQLEAPDDGPGVSGHKKAPLG